MRNNQPVTQKEYDYPDHTTLLSVTDTKGRITYANAAFCAVAGYRCEEMLGKAHNLVRHPDMPPAAFADMWKTLQGGDSWLALVKSRRANGDHYWVRANATPVRRDGQLVGYLSVRTKPTRPEIQAADDLYARMREGRASGLAFHKGLLVHTGLMRWRSVMQLLPVSGRIHAAVLAAWLVTVGLVALAAPGAAVLGTVAGASALALALADAWLQLQIAAPLRTVMRVARSVAAGNPEQHQVMNRVDDIGMLLRAVNQSGLNLRSLVDDVSQQTDGLHVASAEIAAGNNDLSARTEQTASSLEQTAAAMEQLNATVRQNADNARRASGLAQGASDVATRGGAAVSGVVDTVKNIASSSRRIAEIIGTIDGIAFQTNILALNAAVEAARAGEQGRGFAVVASEVRALAGRSSQAAKEIRSLITASVESTDEAAQKVDQAGLTMTEVVDAIHNVTDIMSEISRASSEQSTGVQQVGEAVGLMDQATQQNAALVEQSAAAAESLKGQAQHLLQAVTVFKSGHGVKLRDDPPVVPAAPAPKPPAARRATAAAPAPAVRAPAAQPPAPARVPAAAAATATADEAHGEWETF